MSDPPIINTTCEDCGTRLVDVFKTNPDFTDLLEAADQAARDALYETPCDCGQNLCYQCWSNATHEGHRS